MKKTLLLAAVLMLLPSLAQAAPSGSGGVGVGNGEGRELFSAAVNADKGTPDGTTTVLNEYHQLALDLTEFADTNGQFTVNATGDLICNTSGGVLSNMEMILTADATHSATGIDNFFVVLGECQGCTGDSFPQLLDGDEIAAYPVNILSYSNNVDSLPVPLAGVIPSIADDQCFGLMVLPEDAGAAGDVIAMAAGTFSLYGFGISSQVGSTSDTEILFNNSGSVGGTPNLNWNGSRLFATSFLSANVDGSNAHAFFDNPGGFTCSPATNGGAIHFDSSVAPDTPLMCLDDFTTPEIVLYTTATSNDLEMDQLQISRLDFHNSGDDFVGVRMLMNSVSAGQDYRYRVRVARLGSLQTRLEIENLPPKFFTGGVAANAGIVLQAQDGTTTGHLKPPAAMESSPETWNLSYYSGNVLTGRVVSLNGDSVLDPADTHGGADYYCISALGCTLTLPTAVANQRVCLYDNNGTVGISIKAATGDLINMPGGAGATATGGTMDSFDSGVVGDFACVVALDASTWAVMPSQGTWTETP